MTNIAVASLSHRRLRKGAYIGEVHGCNSLECINSHCWILSNDGEYILLQRRSKKEKFFPGKLDTSFAGHVDEGEDVRHAIIREAYEEGGFNIEKYISKKPKKIIFSELGVFDGYRFTHNQQAFVYYAAISREIINNFKADNKEVGSFKLVKINNFINMVKTNDDRIVRHPRIYYKEVIKDILLLREAIKLT